MALTAQELNNLANAALDYYYAPDGLSPMQRGRYRVKEARRQLREAERELKAALAAQREVRKLPYAERHKPWVREGKSTDTFRESVQSKPLLHWGAKPNKTA